MKWLKLLMVLSVLGLWLGGTNHCKLEDIPGLEFLVCNPHGETEPHQDNDCDEDSCAQVENATYKTEKAQIAVRAPMVLLPAILLPAPQDAELSFRSFERVPPLTPELPVSWQFSYRTAAPPRAPSFLS